MNGVIATGLGKAPDIHAGWSDPGRRESRRLTPLMERKTKRFRTPRTATKFRVEVRGSYGRAVCSGRDLSIDGIRLRGDMLALPEERITIRLLLPPPYEVSFLAKVKWGRADGARNYVLGVRFLHTFDSRKKLQQLLNEVQTGRLGVTRSPNDTRRIQKIRR